MNFLATLRNWLVQDAGWKIFSVLIAVALWLTVHRLLQESILPTASGPERTLTYGNLPVLVVSSSADVHLYRVVPEAVKITVSGSPEAIATLQASQIRASVDLSGSGPTLDMKRSVDVSVPTGITVMSIEPAKVGVILPPAKE